ncbi:GNAT family N-acetyltransferase [Pontibacter beigongshangensis]|uniref:GNAT family N-acetyltransferase n=1 Tax=Pontibacter beigongshangensis TaxID=2574733 RepID=UPI00164F60EB|nr:GNAT family N-acetyltransferase [Pontibacter beigongshangensis]
MEISKLYNSDLPQVYELAFEAWKEAYPGQSDAFIRKVSEFIVRKNYYENAYRYKIVEDGIIKAILLGCEKNDTNNALEWVALQKNDLQDSELLTMNNQKDYLVKSDDLLATFLSDNDIKLALFISNVRGYGTKLLNHFMEEAQVKGKDKMYLWTDSSCNHQYYPKQGFEEVLCIDNANASIVEEDYRTLFYCKKI